MYGNHAFAEGDAGPFKITYNSDNVTYSYNERENLLTIGGSGGITITGDGTPVNCGIKYADIVQISLTIENLNIEAEAPFTAGKDIEAYYPDCLQSTYPVGDR